MRIELKETNLNKKDDILTYIADGVASIFEIDAKPIKDGFVDREAQVSTGMLTGIAVPHTRADIIEPMLFLTKVDKTEDWETLDGDPVDLAIAILVPKDSDDHIKILASVSRKLIDEDNVNKLKSAKSNEEVSEILGV